MSFFTLKLTILQRTETKIPLYYSPFSEPTNATLSYNNLHFILMASSSSSAPLRAAEGSTSFMSTTHNRTVAIVPSAYKTAKAQLALILWFHTPIMWVPLSS